MVVFLMEIIVHLLDATMRSFHGALRVLLKPSSYFKASTRFVSIRERLWSTDLGMSLITSIQKAKWGVTDDTPYVHWKGVQSLKDPFSISLYPLLLWELRPATIIELGSFKGGSAIWMADMMKCMGLDGHIYSFDLQPERVEGSHPDVTFGKVDVNDLESFDREQLASLPHPWLVIEDTHRNVYEILKYFDLLILPGDYFIIEDTSAYKKHREMSKFLRENDERYKVDTKYTDMYGYNVTWHTNGYIRRI